MSWRLGGRHDPRRLALLCAAAAVIVSAGAAISIIAFHDGEPSVLVRMSEGDPMARVARGYDPEFVLVPAEAHFDGVYFYTIALDPFARLNLHDRIDRFEYRYGHPGYAWIASLLAMGVLRDPEHVPAALLLVSLAGMGLAGWAVSMIAVQLGRSPWWGLTVAVNPGLVLSVTSLTSEPVGVALAATGLVLWLRGSVAPACVSLAAACLVKEPFLLVPAGLFVWEGVELLRHRRQRDVAVRLAALAACALPLTLWYLYLRLHLGVFPFERAPDFFGVPLAGWFDSLRRAAGLLSSGASQVGSVAITLLWIVAAAMLVGIVRAFRVRSPLDLMFLGAAALAAVFNWLLLLYPKDILRELTLPLLLLPAVVGTVDWKEPRGAFRVSPNARSPATEPEDRQEEAPKHRLDPERDGRH
jgi:hypothetical protein